jgi:hypothetical protein
MSGITQNLNGMPLFLAGSQIKIFMKNTLLVLSLFVCINALGQPTRNINKSTNPYGINSFGNMYIGDSTLTALITWVFYGSSLTASPGPCSTVAWVTQLSSERQFIPVDSAIPGTGISPNCPVNPSLAMIHRIPGFPVHTAGGKFLFDAGVNDVYSDSVAYALALGQILDTLTMNRGWAASDIYVISSFRASTFTDTQLLKVNIKVCAPRGVNIIDVLHPLYYHYHYLGQNTNCPDSTHPTTLGMLIAENVITNSLPFGSFRGNLTTTGNTVHLGTLTVNGTDSFNSKIYPVGGISQSVANGKIMHYVVQVGGTDYGEEDYKFSNVGVPDTVVMRASGNSGNGSSFDFIHYKTTGQVNMLHIGGSTDATVLGGTTPLAGYLLTVNGNASMAQANVTAGLYVAGDANYLDYRLPLFTNGGTHIGIGINSSNLIKIDNGFGGLAFGSGGASFAAKIEFLLNGHLILNAPNSITDTLSSWLQVKGLSYLGDSVNLGRVATGTTADSVLMIGANHYVHKLAFSAFGGGGGFTNPMTTTNDMIFQTGGTYSRLPAPGHDGMILKSISGSLGWGDTAVNGSTFTIGALNATSTANGLTYSGGVLNGTYADATNGGFVSNTTQTFAGAKTFAGGTILGFATNQAYIRGTGGIFIGDNSTQNLTMNSGASTGTGVMFFRTVTQYNSSDLNVHGQLDIDGNFLFNSTTGSTGGRLLVSAGDVYADAMSSTGGFNWRTNAGGTTLARLIGSNAHFLVNSATDQTLGQLQSTSTTAPQLALYYDATHFFTQQVASTGILSWANLTGWKVPSAALGTTFTAGTDSIVVAHNSAGIETVSLAPLPVITSGTYTPTLTGTQNVSTVTLTQATYTRIGNIVTVQIGGTIAPTVAATITSASFTLPINTSNGSQPNTGTGTITINAGTSQGSVAAGITSTSLGVFSCVPVTTTSDTFSMTIQYTL